MDSRNIDIAFDPPVSKEVKKQAKARIAELRVRLEDIYFAGTGWPDIGNGGDDIGLEAFARIAKVVRARIIPKDSSYLANVESAPCFRNIDTLIGHLRGNLGMNMHWWNKGE